MSRSTQYTGLFQRLRNRQRRQSRRRTFGIEMLEDRLMLAVAPGFEKSFNLDTIGPGSVTTLTFEIDNTENTEEAVSDLAFVDVLPAGVFIAAAPNVKISNLSGVVFTAAAGSDTFTLTGGQIAANAIGTISVDVTSSALTIEGGHFNVTGDLTSSGGNSGTATAELFVDVNRPGFTMAFADLTIPLGGRTTLTYTIDNNLNSQAANSLTFSHSLPAGLEVADPSNGTNDCSNGILGPGVLTAVPGSNSISFLAGFVGDESTCSISLDVIAVGVGTHGTTTGDLTSDIGASFDVSSGKASASIDVTAPVDIHATASFSDDPVAPGNNVNLEFTITNFDRDFAATNIAFSLDLDAVIAGIGAVGLPSSDVLGTGSQLAFAGGVLTLTGGSLDFGASGSFDVTLQIPGATVPGAYPFPINSLVAEIDGEAVTGDLVMDTLFVTAAPSLAATFLNNPAGAGGTTTLEFTVTNISSTEAASDIAFTANLAQFLSGVTVSSLPPAGFLGIGSTISVISIGGEDSLTVDGGNLTAGATETFTIVLDIPGNAVGGAFTFQTSSVTATVNGQSETGPSALAILNVVSAPDLTMEFTDDPVLPGETTTLEFTLVHDQNATADATDVNFTLNLNAVIAGLAAVGLPQSDVVGAGSMVSGTSLVTLTGGTLAPGVPATFSIAVQVPATALPGTHSATTSDINATVDGVATTNGPASTDLQVLGLTVDHSFSSPAIPGKVATLTYTLENVSTTDSLTGITFTHDLDDILAGLTATDTPIADPVGAGSQMTGTTFLTLTGGNLLPGAMATFTVDVMVPAAAVPDVYGSITSDISASFGGSPIVIDPSIATLEVVQAATLTKTIVGGTAAPGGTAIIEYTLVNNSPDFTLTDIAFTDDLGAAIFGLEVNSHPADGFCGAGSTSTGLGTIAISGGSLAPSASCTFQVEVLIPVSAEAGSYPGATSDVTGNLDGMPVTSDGNTATLVVSNNPDFGDAPNSYSTLLASGGPRHLPNGPLLGTLRDTELNAQGPLDGSGDDGNDQDDEDGVTIPTLVVNDAATVSVFASAAGRLDAFVDFNGNGVFDLPSEKVFDNVAVVAGNNNLVVNVPSAAMAGETYARFRISSTGGLSFDGATTDGEVEDYKVTIERHTDIEVTKTDGLTEAGAGDTITYTIVVTNNGPSGTTSGGVDFSDTLPAELIGVSFTSVSAGGATGNTASGNGNIADTLTMPSGSSVTYTVIGTIDSGVLGTIENTATAVVASGNIDPDSNNNSATDSTEVVGLSITNDQLKIGANTITIENAAPNAVLIVVQGTQPGSQALNVYYSSIMTGLADPAFVGFALADANGTAKVVVNATEAQAESGNPILIQVFQIFPETKNTAVKPLLVNQRPELAIADQSIADTETLKLTLPEFDDDGDALTYTATLNGADENTVEAYNLDQSLYLYATPHMIANNFYFNYWGFGEKYVFSGWRLTFLIVPNGDLYLWGWPYPVASLSPLYYANPELLYNAMNPADVAETGDVTVTVMNNMVTIDPQPGFSGKAIVTVSVTDGCYTEHETFIVEVTETVPLLAEGGAAVQSNVASGTNARNNRPAAIVDMTTLETTVAAAIELLADTGLSKSQLDRLNQVEIGLTDLEGARLGQTNGLQVQIDVNAAGYGWFVDDTPYGNDEYSEMTEQGLLAAGDSAAAGRMDLLTVILHELGHVLGMDDHESVSDTSDLMYATLATSLRKLPTR